MKFMRIIARLSTGVLFLSFLLCSCATKDSCRPTTVKMNKDAGRGSWLIMKIRFDDGKKLPFMVDTGCPFTILDKSLEPKLGECLGVATVWYPGVEHKMPIYAAPHLYLGNTQLLTDTNLVLTADSSAYSSMEDGPTMGIIGMDILKNYCIQLDFKQGVVRFLNDECINTNALGKVFHLTQLGDGCFILNKNLIGAKDSSSLIDTGNNTDGSLLPNLFQLWTNQTIQVTNIEAHAPDGVLDGQIYHDLNLQQGSGGPHQLHNTIGINFLAKHLVTLDFPKHTMYLKRTGDLTPYLSETLPESLGPIMEAMLRQGLLPGFSKQEDGTITKLHYHAPAYPYVESVTLEVRKKDDPSIYSYTFSHPSNNAPWKLQKAWRTDQDGRQLEEYNCP